MRWMTPILAGMLLLTVPIGQAEPTVEAPQADCGDEPCGYIVPIIDIQFPDKMLCGGGRLVYADETPEDCYPLMAKGESQTLSGILRIYWDAQEEPTYPSDPENPIRVSFSGTQSNPDWLEIQFEPASFEIGAQDLYDPDRYVIDPEGTPIMTYDWQEPIDVTFTRTGDPSGKWLDKIEDRNGVVPTFIKARTSSSGQYYKEAFGVEEFRFNAYAGDIEAAPSDDGDTAEAPGIAPALLLGVLAALAVARRRR